MCGAVAVSWGSPAGGAAGHNANPNTMSAKLHRFATIAANLDSFALSLEQVVMKKSENIDPKLTYSKLFTQNNAFKIRESEKDEKGETKDILH